MMDQLLQRIERSEPEGVRELIGDMLTGAEQALEIRLSLFPLVQRVMNPPFINPHLPKMYRIVREFLPCLEEEDLKSLVRLEINEYTRRPKSAGLARPDQKIRSVSFPRIESAIRDGDREKAAALMQAYLEQEGEVELARRLLLLGSGYLDHSLGHSLSCTAFILLEMIERRDQDPWPALGTLADYFCRGRFQNTPGLRGRTEPSPQEEPDWHLLRATSGYGVVNLHHTITRYAIERVRHLLGDGEYDHMITCWIDFLGSKSEETYPHLPVACGQVVADYESFFRCFSNGDEQTLLSSLGGLISSQEGRLRLGRYLVKGVCDRYQGNYDPHFLTGLGSALWVVERYRDRPVIAMNALSQYLNYFFTLMAG